MPNKARWFARKVDFPDAWIYSQASFLRREHELGFSPIRDKNLFIKCLSYFMKN